MTKYPTFQSTYKPEFEITTAAREEFLRFVEQQEQLETVEIPKHVNIILKLHVSSNVIEVDFSDLKSTSLKIKFY